jgi:hypothetical protein
MKLKQLINGKDLKSNEQHVLGRRLEPQGKSVCVGAASELQVVRTSMAASDPWHSIQPLLQAFALPCFFLFFLSFVGVCIT